MNIRFTAPRGPRPPRPARPADAGTGPVYAGALAYTANPSPETAEAVRRTLGQATAPREVLFAMRPPAPRAASPLERAAGSAALGLLKLATKELARSSGAPGYVAFGVDAVWTAIGAGMLYRRWEEGASIPTVLVGAGELTLDALGAAEGLGLDVLPDRAASDLGVVAAGLGAVAEGGDVNLAVMDAHLAATPSGALVGMARGLLSAAISDAPAFDAVQLSDPRRLGGGTGWIGALERDFTPEP